MTRTLRSRLENLEAILTPAPKRTFLYGWFSSLPDDYVGERHVALLSWEPTGDPMNFWCDWEERPGPDPDPKATRVIEKLPLTESLDALVAKAATEGPR